MSFQIAEAMKMQQWERCKGELNALISLQGSHACTDLHFSARRSKLLSEVKKFVKRIEENELYC